MKSFGGMLRQGTLFSKQSKTLKSFKEDGDNEEKKQDSDFKSDTSFSREEEKNEQTKKHAGASPDND